MVDINGALDAVDREVGTREIDGVDSRVQVLRREFRAPLADVWDAMTSIERIPRWFMPVEGELQLGGSYQLIGNAGGQILACEPPADGRAGYSISWGMGMGDPATVHIRMTETAADRTVVELENTIAVGSLPPGMWEQFGPGATGIGWDGGLLGLGLHLAGDTSVTPETAEAWQLSPEGRAFTRASADAWARAHVAAGADADAAAAAAEACVGFYTGETV